MCKAFHDITSNNMVVFFIKQMQLDKAMYTPSETNPLKLSGLYWFNRMPIYYFCRELTCHQQLVTQTE